MAFFGGGGASVDLASPSAIGSTTPNTGAFTTIESTSRQFITATNGSVQIGRSGGNALGSGALNIQTQRGSNSQVASASGSVAIGNTTASGTNSLGIFSANNSGGEAIASGNSAIAVGAGANTLTRAQGNASVAIGGDKPFGGGTETIADGTGSIAIGNGTATGNYAIAIGAVAKAGLYGQISFGGFSPRANNFVQDATTILHWAGTTTDNTQTEIFLGGVASNRATIGANRMWTGTINIGAVMSNSSKAFFSYRTVAIKRDNANNTALVGSLQTLGTDQTTGSPTWSVDIDANDTNESLRIRVTGATSETVYWKVTAILQELG